jgi:hypothetical protein
MTDVSIDTRILLVRVWSDGFEAHQIKGKNEYNSLQMFTLTVIAPNYKNTSRHTAPFTLCFQRQNQNDILIQLLKELKDLQSPTLRYWGGKENQVYPTMVFLEMISNDYVERCSNTCPLKMVHSLTDGDIWASSMTISFHPVHCVTSKTLNTFFCPQL